MDRQDWGQLKASRWTAEPWILSTPGSILLVKKTLPESLEESKCIRLTVLEDVQANAAVAANVWMVDASSKANLGRLKCTVE